MNISKKCVNNRYMKALTLAFLFILLLCCSVDGEGIASDVKLREYILNEINIQNPIISDDGLEMDQIGTNVMHRIGQLSCDKLLIACKYIDTSTVKMFSLKYQIITLIGAYCLKGDQVEEFRSQLTEVLSRWEALAASSSGGPNSSEHYGYIMVLKNVVRNINQKLRFVDTVTRLRLANDVSLEIVSFPGATMKSIKPGKEIWQDLLDSTDYCKMYGQSSPMSSAEDVEEEFREAFINAQRECFFTKGRLLYIKSGENILAGLIYCGGRAVFIQDMSGSMKCGLDIYPKQLIKLLEYM